MITIGKLQFVEKDKSSRIESVLRINNEKSFTLFVETEKEWGGAMVTERADAFLVGVLMYALVNGHDIKCEQPVTSELLYSLENLLIPTLVKHDNRFYHAKLLANGIDEPIPNKGAVGTGISLGLDSFCTIAEMQRYKHEGLSLTHLVTYNNGVLGGWYQKNNWDYCARKLYEKEMAVAKELGLPLISLNTNLPKLMRIRADYYVTYMSAMLIMSMGKLFSTYFQSSDGADFSYFNVKQKYMRACDRYELLTLNCFSTRNSVRFLSGGGARDRNEKMQIISQFSLARENLQSCLTQHYNCMKCEKCKRNLVTMDALGLLDAFKKVYDIEYYRAHRNEYIEWMVEFVSQGTHGDLIRPAYELLKEREPELIASYEITLDEAIKQKNEYRRQRDVYKMYTSLFRKLMSKPNWENRLNNWFAKKEIQKVILYGNSVATQLLYAARQQLSIEIVYVVEDIAPGVKREIPRLSENTIDYPECDAVIICNVDKTDLIRRKLSDVLKDIPIYDIKEVLQV